MSEPTIFGKAAKSTTDSAKSWKTTVFGLAGLLIMIGIALQGWTDDDPETSADWGKVIEGAIVFLIGLFAKDGDKDTDDSSNPYLSK